MRKLPALYSGAFVLCVSFHISKASVCPCWKAMQCGTPVIAGDRTSLPEVTGDAAILVDPFGRSGYRKRDPESRKKIRIVRAELCVKGLERAAAFQLEKPPRNSRFRLMSARRWRLKSLSTIVISQM
jgi:hypothetical protein